MGLLLPLSLTVGAICNLEKLLSPLHVFWPAVVPALPWEPISTLLFPSLIWQISLSPFTPKL